MTIDFNTIIEGIKNFFLFSGKTTNSITEWAVKTINLNPKQATAIPMFINLIFLFILFSLASGMKKWIKIILIIVLIWILIGFFI